MIKKTKVRKALAGSAVTVFALNAMAAATTMAVETSGNFSGSNRIDTANKIADASWSGAWKGQTTAIIVAQEDSHLVDGLAVAPLAYQQKAPILLSASGDTISPETMAELAKNGVTKVYLATGSGVITDKAKAQLEAKGIVVERLGGTTRYETAQNIAKKLGAVTKVAVVNGEVGLADAMSIAAIAANQGMAIALTNGKDAVPTTLDLTGKTVFAIGGTGVLSTNLVSNIKATRLGGNTRFETNAQVLDAFKTSLNFGNVYLAEGSSAHLIDSLTGSVLAAQTSAPIVLTDAQMGSNQQTVLNSNLTKDSSVVTFGGAVNKSVQTSVQKIVDDKKSTGVSASLVEVDNSLMGTSIVEVRLTNVSDPQNYNVTIKGQPATYYASSNSFKIASSTYLEASDINVSIDVTITKKVVVTASLVGVDNSLMGTSIVEVKLNVSDPENYNVTFKGQAANYYASSQSFKIASSSYLAESDINIANDVVIAHK